MKAITNLDNIMGGAVSERVVNELNLVLENVFDTNTDAKAVREVTLKIKVKPNANRDGAEFQYEARSKLAPVSALSQTVFLQRRDDGSVLVVDHNGQLPGQVDIDGDVNIPNIMEFASAKK